MWRALLLLLPGLSWCSELAPDCQHWHQLRTSSPCPLWNESRGPSHSSWKGAAAQCLHTPMKEKVFKALIMYRWAKGFVQKDKLDKCANSVLPEGDKGG